MTGMMMHRVCGVLLLLAGAIVPSAGQKTEDTVPGGNVSVTTTPELKAEDTIAVTLTPSSDKFTAVVDPALHGFKISLSSDIVADQYQISAQRMTTQGSTQPIALILSPKAINVQPVVTAIDPKALYRDGGNTVTFLGPASLKNDTNYGIVFEGHALARCPEGATQVANCFKLSEKSENGQIKFEIGEAFLKSLSGKQSVSLTHNGGKSQAQTLTIVSANRNDPRNYAVAVAAGLVVLVYLLLSAGRRGLQTNKRTFLLSALFLDEETKSYSLSKCQFYLWTLAAILGYVFLAISKSVVQGSAVFPDVPEGLPGILLASAGTAVLATGITSSKGTKGAGAEGPSLADFITTGGVVAPERLQFVVWTLVGIVTFLTIVFNSDPLTLDTLPKIPSGFLELMGISSAGYLGGKLARKAGPVIKVVSVAKVTEAGNLDQQYAPTNGPLPPLQYPVLTLHLQGTGMDPKGSIKVDGAALRGDMFWITGTADPQSGFCTDLLVTLNKADAYIKENHTLTLVNSDSQSSDVAFPVDPIKIETISERGANGNATVTGQNFVAPTTYEWRDAQGAIIPVDPANPNAVNHATVQSKTSLTVSRPAAIVAGCKLILISQTRLRFEKAV